MPSRLPTSRWSPERVLAVAAAWIGGWFDSSLAMILDVLFAFPGILLAVVAAAVFGPGLTSAVMRTVDRLPAVCRASAARRRLA